VTLGLGSVFPARDVLILMGLLFAVALVLLVRGACARHHFAA
jgi:hypothetical protein